MEQKPQKRDLRNHFEAILGHEIADIEAGLIGLGYRTGLWSQELETGHVTSKDIHTNGNSRTVCGESLLFSVGGQTTTDNSGKADFLLSEYHCGSLGFGFGMTPQLPIIFVASAQSPDPVPVFVTTYAFGIVSNGAIEDFRVHIYTWEPNGAPAKGKSVNWLCQFPFTVPPFG